MSIRVETRDMGAQQRRLPKCTRPQVTDGLGLHRTPVHGISLPSLSLLLATPAPHLEGVALLTKTLQRLLAGELWAADAARQA